MPLFCRLFFLTFFLFSYQVLLCTSYVVRAAYVTDPRAVVSARN